MRYERARIASDLHDIVAHNLSMIVVQAGAGRRALSANPAAAAESLAHIQGGAVHAEREIARLADLLSDHEPVTEQTGLRAVNELVQRATATGLAVSYTFSGDADRTRSQACGRCRFHITQEGITNALKHAPGARICVTVHAADGRLSIVVENEAPRDIATDLGQIGGAHGIAGLRARVIAAGGDLRAGPDAHGGWQLAAELPIN